MLCLWCEVMDIGLDLVQPGGQHRGRGDAVKASVWLCVSPNLKQDGRTAGWQNGRTALANLDRLSKVTQS